MVLPDTVNIAQDLGSPKRTGLVFSEVTITCPQIGRVMSLIGIN